MVIKKALALSVALTAGLALAACGSDDENSTESTNSAAATSSQASVTKPTATELGDILNRAVDPNVPTDQKVSTVVGGESAPEIFDALTKMKADTGAELQVVEPVMQEIIPTQAKATVNLTVPDQEPAVISDVLFINEAGQWKLDQKWACTLIQNVMPDNVPAMCGAPVQEAPAEGEAAADPAAEAPAPAEAPAEEAPVVEAPAQ